MKYFVYIHKQYFPKSLWTNEIAKEDFAQWDATANSRKEAAEKVWRKHGQELLSQMNPNQTKLPRKVSLFVGSNGGDSTSYAGRLPPILVYTGK